MIHIGEYQKLNVVRITPHGVMLAEPGNTDPLNEILMPNKFVPQHTKQGDVIEVFIYKDSEDRPVATTQRPLVTVNHAAYLTVKDITRIGAFLDWGLDKDLLLPYAEQSQKVEKDDFVLVYVFLDKATQRIVATNNMNKFIKNREVPLKVGDKVQMLICYDNEIGVRVIINQKHWGLLFKSEIFGSITQGDTIPGYIKNIREDGKIDVSLRPQGIAGMRDARNILLEKLQAANGVIQLSDNSEPDQIYNELGISKKAFKKAAGILYKEGKIEMGDNFIRLQNDRGE